MYFCILVDNLYRFYSFGCQIVPGNGILPVNPRKYNRTYPSSTKIFEVITSYAIHKINNPNHNIIFLPRLTCGTNPDDANELKTIYNRLTLNKLDIEGPKENANAFHVTLRLQNNDAYVYQSHEFINTQSLYAFNISSCRTMHT